MTYDIVCEECDTEYNISDDDDLEIAPKYCPYCGHDAEKYDIIEEQEYDDMDL